MSMTLLRDVKSTERTTCETGRRIKDIETGYILCIQCSRLERRLGAKWPNKDAHTSTPQVLVSRRNGLIAPDVGCAASHCGRSNTRNRPTCQTISCLKSWLGWDEEVL